MFQFVDFLRKMQKMQRFHRHEGSIPFARSIFHSNIFLFDAEGDGNVLFSGQDTLESLTRKATGGLLQETLGGF